MAGAVTFTALAFLFAAIRQESAVPGDQTYIGFLDQSCLIKRTEEILGANWPGPPPGQQRDIARHALPGQELCANR
jgi:hypothetical protein